jgi:hypothetical protein
VKVLRASFILHSTDRQAALLRYEQLFETRPVTEFPIPGRDLVATAFAGFSVLSGRANALGPLRDLRGIVFVDSLREVEKKLIETGWKKEGSLGSSDSLLARDPDGNLLEFVEEPVDESPEETG